MFALLFFSMSGCQEDKNIISEKASVTVEQFTDAVIADEHFQNVLTIISAGLDGKADESAVEEQLNILYNAEKTDYLRSMFEMVPVSGSSEEHVKAVFAQLNKRINAEFEDLYSITDGAMSANGSANKGTPCFDRLTNDRAAISTTVVLCTAAALIHGSLEAVRQLVQYRLPLLMLDFTVAFKPPTNP
ncbi:hypothetical protein [Neolewinella persica]|uniref:hypothetical protein n=1 Tax=Neolewinella persica TaxID=70998 RepID=UPI0003A7255C|nr:hypothetical protein [Neolewinella persica]